MAAFIIGTAVGVVIGLILSAVLTMAAWMDDDETEERRGS